MTTMHPLKSIATAILVFTSSSLISYSLSPRASSAEPSEPIASENVVAGSQGIEPVGPNTQPETAPAAAQGSAISDREAALRQAEDDLLKKLSGSLAEPLPSAAPENSNAAIVVANPVTEKPAAVPAGDVLAERIGAPAAAAPVAAPSSVSSTSGVQPLGACQPCSVQAAAPAPRKVAKRSSSSSASARRVIDSDRASVREDFVFHGSASPCSQSIDDPYVPTSEKARVTASRAHLRIAPGPAESTIFTMPRDSIVSIETRDGQWYRVKTSTGIRGWIATRDVLFDYDVPSSSTVRVSAYKAEYETPGMRF